MNQLRTICLLAAVLLSSPFMSFGQNIVHKEMLSSPTDHSVNVQAFFDQEIEAQIIYGTTAGNLTQSTGWNTYMNGSAVFIHLDGLDSDTRYYYQLQYRTPGSTSATARPEHTFHTQRAIGSGFTFIVQADPHLDEMSDTALYSICLQNQVNDQPDFILDLGDFLMTDKLKNSSNQVPHDTIPYRAHLLRGYYEKVNHSAPLFLVVGNHEGETGWYQDGTAENMAIWDTQERKKYFPNPEPDGFYSGDTTNYDFVGKRQSYYSWTWGDALYVVYDPYWFTNPKPDSLHGWRWTLGETQYNWLKETLENSTVKYKFVFGHQIVGGDAEGRGGVERADFYEWGGNNIDGTPGFAENRPGWYAPIKTLLEENHVNIFFHGHDHFFGKQEKDCLIYQETPQPSLPNFQHANMAAEYGYVQGQILPNAGHLRLTVQPEGVQVEYVRAYKPESENATRHNGDISATYFIGAVNCYDSLTTVSPIIWNSLYKDELIYPNPVSDNSTIEFAVKKAEKTTILIHNAQGQLMRVLLDHCYLQMGDFQTDWNGKDASGNRLPSGAYTVSIEGEFSGRRTQKVILE